MRKSALACALSLAYAAPSYATEGIDWPSLSNTVIRTVAMRRSLPAPVSPFSFAQDRAGFLWAGGQAGLLRWDGYQFQAYTPSGGREDGLANHFIQVLHADRSGQLWAGTEEGGLARYDEATDRFEPVILADRNGEARRVWSLDDDGAGGLWIGTNRGLAHLDARGQVLRPLAAAGAGPPTIFDVPDRKVEAVLRSRQGTLWIGGGTGLARLGRGGQALPLSLPTENGRAPEVSHLVEDSAGRIWAGTRYDGAYVVDAANLQARAVPNPPGMASRTGGLEIVAMEEIAPGRVWLSTFGHGILDVQAASLAVRALVHDPRLPGTVDSNLVYGLYRDRSGVTWIGTSEAIDQFVPPAGGIFTLFGGPGSPRGIPADVSAVLARSDGRVWLGTETDGEGLIILDAGHKSVRAVKLPRVVCLAADAAGPVYIGTRSGLFVASASGESVRKVEFAAHRANAGIVSLLLTGDAMWVGDDDGLWELQLDADAKVRVVRHVGAPPLPAASIESLALAPGGKLAVGTAHGVALMDRNTGEIETIRLDPVRPHDMAAGQVVSFLTDRLGRLWIGTDDSGIAVLLGRDTGGRPLFHRITTDDGLPDPDVNRMLADSAGRVWVATDNGLAVIDPDSFAVRALRAPDGVAISTYLNLSGDTTQQGDLLFGGHGGLTVVRPQDVGFWGYRAPLAITQIHVGGKLVRTRAAEIVIEPEANSLAVEFAALDFSAPDRNIYRYRLEGFDSDFIATDSRHRVATYTNLPPGAYTLRLQGSNRNGVWTPPVAFRISVLPAWFQTIYVRIAEIALFAAFGGAILHGRTAWLRRRQLHLESIVQERTLELVSSQKKLTELAYFDPLTALPNRRAFNESLQELLEAAVKRQGDFVLILIDLDGFKRVNDTLGHDAGDAVLVFAAGRLRVAVREGDAVARLGGDEFAILLTRIKDRDDVKPVCDRVVTGMTTPINIKGETVSIGASVGVAHCPGDGRTAEELYKRADEALYAAKRAGKGMWCWYKHSNSAGATALYQP